MNLCLKESDCMTVLDQEEIDHIVIIQDYIMKHENQKSVADIRKKYHLTREEYDMIFDLCMPKFRNNLADKYRAMFFSLKSKVETGLLMANKNRQKEALDYIDNAVDRYRGLTMKEIRNTPIEELSDDNDDDGAGADENSGEESQK